MSGKEGGGTMTRPKVERDTLITVESRSGRQIFEFSEREGTAEAQGALPRPVRRGAPLQENPPAPSASE